ncbi:class I SAM-dependent methyltransferase [Candidatus Sumerlaeota bacterium]|nr:class I SAM-dependent methyltransferase [Candidatus Sumerlaeota bacterium]
MRTTVYEDTYSRGGHEFCKKVDTASGTFALSMDGKAVTLDEWNRAVNRYFPMSLKSAHGNALIRMKERSRIRGLVRLLLQDHPKSVADVGCEAGHIAREMLPYVERIVCIDSDPEMAAKALGSLRSPKASALVADASELPVQAHSLDALLAASILEHVARPVAAVKEFARLVRPGGLVLVSVPNDRAVMRIKTILRATGLGRLLGRLASGLAMGHIHVFTRATLREVAASAGKVIRCGFLRPFLLDIYALVRV